MPPSSTTRRTWAQIRELLADGRLSPDVGERARGAFERLATAEARVHGGIPDDVHFHEVGALDAIADIVGAAAGMTALNLAELQVSPVALGSGTVSTAHGLFPVPPPAVVELLKGAPSYGGGADVELTTPTGAALVTEFATSWGAQPPMAVQRQGVGAGGCDLADRPNVVRLIVGESLEPQPATLLLEANVDDIDPRLWPPILARLLEAGASDAWLAPIVMKKGRLAHTLSVLVDVPGGRSSAACHIPRDDNDWPARDGHRQTSSRPGRAKRRGQWASGPDQDRDTGRRARQCPARVRRRHRGCDCRRPAGQGGSGRFGGRSESCGARAVIRTARLLTGAALIVVLSSAVAPSAHAEEPAAGVVLVGIAGLAWQDVTARGRTDVALPGQHQRRGVADGTDCPSLAHASWTGG